MQYRGGRRGPDRKFPCGRFRLTLCLSLAWCRRLTTPGKFHSTVRGICGLKEKLISSFFSSDRWWFVLAFSLCVKPFQHSECQCAYCKIIFKTPFFYLRNNTVPFIKIKNWWTAFVTFNSSYKFPIIVTSCQKTDIKVVITWKNVRRIWRVTSDFFCYQICTHRVNNHELRFY